MFEMFWFENGVKCNLWVQHAFKEGHGEPVDSRW